MVFEKIDSEEFVKTFEYRGFTAYIGYDDYGQSYFTRVDGEDLCFGSYNPDYEEDLKYLIDRELDTLYEFPEFPGSRLEWFYNGYTRDIRLVYRGRIIKVFLVFKEDEITEISIEKLKKESLKIIKKIDPIVKNIV